MWTWPAAAVLAIGLTFSPARAQDTKAVLGTLTCTAVEGEVNRFARETVVLSCLFRAAEGGYAETYVGTLRRLGGSPPINGPLVLMWTVAGDTGALAPGILEQNYLSAGRADDPLDRQLRGQKNAAIVLRPFMQNGEATEQTVTALDLDLKQTKA